MNRALSFVILIFGIIAMSNAQFSHEVEDWSGKCKTRSGIDGICGLITDCPPYIELLKNRGKGPDVVDFLNEINCGFAGKISKVCCVDDTTELIESRFGKD